MPQPVVSFTTGWWFLVVGCRRHFPIVAQAVQKHCPDPSIIQTFASDCRPFSVIWFLEKRSKYCRNLAGWFFYLLPKGLQWYIQIRSIDAFLW